MDIVILDTGCANLSSVSYAIQRLGYKPIISKDADIILNSKKLLLPGVGTATAAMQQLKERNLISLIKNCTQPVLGICLGMQLLANKSEEGAIETLGIIDSNVLPIPECRFPLPHMGWNQVTANDNPLFKNIDNNSYFYFIHSFAMPVNQSTIATVQYGDLLTAAVQKDNFFGVQFHPERSGTAGAKLLNNFLEM